MIYLDITRQGEQKTTNIMPLGYKIGVKYDDIKQDINVQHRGRYEIYTINNNDKNIINENRKININDIVKC